MKEKKLILFNGRWSYRNQQTIYLAAYSMADACRICAELAGHNRGWYKEIKVYFHKGCWGNSMEGIPVERGAWVGPAYGEKEKPVRVYPIPEGK